MLVLWGLAYPALSQGSWPVAPWRQRLCWILSGMPGPWSGPKGRGCAEWIDGWMGVEDWGEGGWLAG